MEARILQHVEHLEYMKELARQIALQLLGEVDVREMVADPGAFVDRLVAVLLAQLGPYARNVAEEAAQYASDLGLAELDSGDIDEIANEAENKFIGFATPALRDAVDAIAARVNDMILAGVALPSIHSALTSTSVRGTLVAPITGAAKRLAAAWIQFVERDVNDAAVSLLMLEPQDDTIEPMKLTWVAVMDKNTCGDDEDPPEHFCRPRHGTARTLADWAGIGMPGSPVLDCSMHAHRGASPCRCILSTNPDAASVEKPVSAAEAIKNGRARAAADFAAARAA